MLETPYGRDGFVEVAAGGGMFLTGQLIEDKKLADTGIVTLEACLIDGVATEALKYAVGRERPNRDGDKMSFPSGHTSVAAALAASVSEMYDWDLRLAVPLYATVVFVGISRWTTSNIYPTFSPGPFWARSRDQALPNIIKKRLRNLRFHFRQYMKKISRRFFFLTVSKAIGV